MAWREAVIRSVTANGFHSTLVSVKQKNLALLTISTTMGCLFSSAVCAKPGVTIKGEINHKSGLIALLGEVRWNKKVPPNILHKLKGGMGVRIISFLSGEELYHAPCDELVEQRGS
jgi:hypothetical protein